MSEKSIGETNYENFADLYAEKAPTKPHNAYYDRPAVISLLPDVKGLEVLDVGCGPGIYAEWLVDHGARVLAFDVTPRFVELTRERVGDRAEVIVANLEEPLSFAADNRFDLITCPLVLDYIRDWLPVFKEFQRVLKPGGMVVCSFGHPTADFFQYFNEGNYFDTEFVEMEWGGFGEPKPVIRNYRRSLQDALNPMIDAGLRIDHVLEPRPTREYEAASPEFYAHLMRTPGFLCIRAKKD